MVKERETEVTLEIEVSQEVVEQEVEQIYKELAQTAKVRGFRRGKAPRNILEMHYQKEIEGDVIQRLIPKAYQEAVKETNIIPLVQAEIKEVQLEKGKPLSFKAVTEIKPAVKLGQYKGIKVEKKIVGKIKEKDVRRKLEELQEKHAFFIPIENRNVEKGDFVIIDFKGLMKEIPFVGGTGENYTLKVDSNSLFGLGKHLLGMGINEKKEIKVRLPKDYPQQELRGQEALFKVTLKEIKEKKIPSLDDEFAKDLGESQTLKELKIKIKGEIEKEGERKAEEELKENIINKLIETCELEVPTVLIERQIDYLFTNLKQNLKRQGLTFNQYLHMVKMSEVSLKERYKPSAFKQVKADLIIETVADQENIEVTEEETTQRIEEMAFIFKEEPAKLKERLEKEKLILGIKEQIKREKTLDFLMKEAKIKKVKK